MDGAPIVEGNLYLEQKKEEFDREQMSLSEAGIVMHLLRFSSHPGPKLGAYRYERPSDPCTLLSPQ